jgi:hypothetical protein
MKQLYWKKLNNVQGTVWSKVNFEQVDIDPRELEQAFSFEEKNKGEKEKDQKTSKEGIGIIDPGRARNVGIFLASNKLNGTEVRNALLSMNEKVVNLENIKELIKLTPTVDEEKALRTFSGAVEDLGPAEKFFLVV